MDRIDDLTADVFNFLIQLRRLDANAQPPPETVLQRLRSLIDTMGKRAADLGFSREDVLEITYAIVALADEAAIYAGGNLRQYWMQRPLQLQYFNENVAGENFFARVMALRQDARRVDVVRVYYTCLVLGFQGKYRVRGGEVELASLVERVAASLRADSASSQLSPSGARPRDGRSGVQRALPLIGASVAAVVLSLVLYSVLRFSVASSADEIATRIASIIGG